MSSNYGISFHDELVGTRETGYISAEYQQKKTFQNNSGSAISKGMAVQIDETVSSYFLGGHIQIQSDTTLGASAAKFIGIAAHDIANGAKGEVIVAGLAYAECAAGVAANDELTTDNATDGHLETTADATPNHVIVAVALEALSATITGQALVRIFPTM